jgi:hypothetical protein
LSAQESGAVAAGAYGAGRPEAAAGVDVAKFCTAGYDWLLVLDDAALDLPAPGKRQP